MKPDFLKCIFKTRYFPPFSVDFWQKFNFKFEPIFAHLISPFVSFHLFLVWLIPDWFLNLIFLLKSRWYLRWIVKRRKLVIWGKRCQNCTDSGKAKLEINFLKKTSRNRFSGRRMKITRAYLVCVNTTFHCSAASNNLTIYIAGNRFYPLDSLKLLHYFLHLNFVFF